MPTGILPVDVSPSGDLANFWDELSDGGIDGLCKNAQLALSQSAKLLNASQGDLSYGIVISGSTKRTLRPFADKRLALIDEAGLKLAGNIKKDLLTLPNLGPVTVVLNAGIEGVSSVMRPLPETSNYCSELTELLKLYDFKTVFPLNAGRITKMVPGEIWKLPLYARYSISINPGMRYAQLVDVTIGGGVNGERKPMVSLYRKDENTLRLRLRIEHVIVKSLNASAASVAIPASDLGLDSGTNFLTQTLEKTAAGEINKFLAFKLGLNFSRSTGQKLLLEFTLDPKDAEQMESLAEFLKGDFDILRRLISMGLQFDALTGADTAADGVKELTDLSGRIGSKIELNGTFTGSDHYDGTGTNFSFNIPVVRAQSENWGQATHRYQSLANNNAVYHIQQANRSHSGEMLHIPFVGQLIKKHNYRKDLFVANRERVNGKVSDPLMFYQEQQGLIRHGDHRAREALDSVNNVVRYAGMRGNGVNYDNYFPVREFFPPKPSTGATGGDGNPQLLPEKVYRSVVLSFQLAFSEKAVQDIILSAPQQILKAYMNVMRETEPTVIGKVMDLFAVSESGKVGYDSKAVQARLHVIDNAEDSTNPMNTLRIMARAATRFIEKLIRVREESDWNKQAGLLSAAASTGDLQFEDFLKVVIQLVNVGDISSTVTIHTDKKIIGEADINQSYQLFNQKKGNGFDSKVAEILQMRDRFLNPSALTD